MTEVKEMFVWSAIFETGVEQVDAQHRHLVDLINEAVPALSDPALLTPARVRELVAQLTSYAVFHFRDEETLMLDKGLHRDFFRLQVAQHRDFVLEVEAMSADLEQGRSSPADSTSMLRFLVSWLAYHILGTDQLMADQIRRIDAGATATEAYALAREPRDASMVRPLLDALTGLHQVISSRNLALREANAALRRAESDLVASNEALEQRVTLRTAQLREALEKAERAQGQLLQSEKMAAIGQLAAGVAHEINNPVGFVNANLGALGEYVAQLLDVVVAAEELSGGLPETNPRRQRYQAARQAADLDFLRKDIADLLDESIQGLDRVKKIVQDLKDFSHVDEAEWQDANLNAGLESTLNVVSSEIKYKAQVVRKYGDLPPVRCLAAQINQVFLNLLVNAGQAIEAQGIITLSTGAAADHVWVEVRDTGKGMSEDVRRRIFEPFYTTKPVGQGTGLGLSIVWDIIVKKHAGKLEVSSTPGAGTCFRIELPFNRSQEE